MERNRRNLRMRKQTESKHLNYRKVEKKIFKVTQ